MASNKEYLEYSAGNTKSNYKDITAMKKQIL